MGCRSTRHQALAAELVTARTGDAKVPSPLVEGDVDPVSPEPSDVGTTITGQIVCCVTADGAATAAVVSPEERGASSVASIVPGICGSGNCGSDISSSSCLSTGCSL